MAWQGCLEIVVWDVEHGNATSVRLPNGNVIMLDCGSNPKTGFSPVLATLRLWGRIDALFVSHPHMDHIGDICSMGYRLPQYLVSPPVPAYRVLEGKHGDDLRTSACYTAFKAKYRPIPFIPQEFFGNVSVSCFSLNGPHRDMNAYSIVTFLQYGAFTFLYAGDLPTSHWPKLAQAHGRRLVDLLAATNFFEVSHHGRSEGYSADVVSTMDDPRLAFVSDKEEQGTSVTGRYDHYFKGWPAYNEATGRQEYRKVLTTRNDGRISLRAWPPAVGASQHVEARFGGRLG